MSDIVNSKLSDSAVDTKLSPEYSHTIRESNNCLPSGFSLNDSGRAVDGKGRELRPRARCSKCGTEQVFSDILSIAAQNRFGGGCPIPGGSPCGGRWEVVSFLAPPDKLRRRIEDQLRKNPLGRLQEIAELLNVNIGN